MHFIDLPGDIKRFILNSVWLEKAYLVICLYVCREFNRLVQKVPNPDIVVKAGLCNCISKCTVSYFITIMDRIAHVGNLELFDKYYSAGIGGKITDHTVGFAAQSGNLELVKYVDGCIGKNCTHTIMKNAVENCRISVLSWVLERPSHRSDYKLKESAFMYGIASDQSNVIDYVGVNFIDCSDYKTKIHRLVLQTASIKLLNHIYLKSKILNIEWLRHMDIGTHRIPIFDWCHNNNIRCRLIE